MMASSLINFSNSNAAFFRRSLNDMRSLRANAERLQQSIGTGERLSRSSDDPVAAAQLRELSRAGRLAEVDTANAARTAEQLTLGADAITDIANELIRARELAIFAASGTASDAQRALVADELDQLRTSLLAAANARGNDGTALFGGETGGAAYAEDASGTVSYIGTSDPGELSIGAELTIRRGVTGPEFLNFTDGAGNQTDVFTFFANLALALRGGAADPAAAARDALGGLDNALDSTGRAQTILGARLAWIDSIQARQVDLAESRAQESSAIGDTDLTTAIAELQQTLTVLEASQAGFVRISSLTLFNAI